MRAVLRGRIRLTLGLILLVALVAAAIVVGGPAALVLTPALVLALPFLVDRYPGERLLAAVRRRDVRRPRDEVARLPRAPRALGSRRAPLARLGASRAPPALSLS